MNEGGTRDIGAIGMAWYKRADYERIRTIMVDSGRMSETFDKWEAGALRIEEEQRSRGIRLVRAYIEPDAFVAWCGAKGWECDAPARMRWAGEAAKRSLGGAQH